MPPIAKILHTENLDIHGVTSLYFKIPQNYFLKIPPPPTFSMYLKDKTLYYAIENKKDKKLG